MMARFLLACLLVGATTLEAEAGGKSVHVKGYTRKDGTYVPPHTRSAPRTTARGFTPYSQPPSLPRDVPVDGYTEGDGTDVRPHMRHIDGIKDPKWLPSARGKSSSRGADHRTAHRATARGLVASAKPQKRYPSRQWHSADGSVLAEGRMKSKAMNKLTIERADGSLVYTTVEELGDDDRDWLDTASRFPERMKTDPMPLGANATNEQAGEDVGDEEPALK